MPRPVRLRAVARAISIGLVLAIALAASAGHAQPPKFEVLHRFDGNTEGFIPTGRLLLASDGNFYGTLVYGPHGLTGAIYRATPQGDVTILHFLTEYEGRSFVGLTEGPDGMLYGGTVDGGFYGEGILYRISKTGDFEEVHEFVGWPGDAGEMESELVLAADGTMYGSTGEGGSFGNGSVFALHPDGTVKVLHSFDDFNSVDVSVPGGLVIGADGMLYGVFDLGAGCRYPDGHCGGVFALSTDGAQFHHRLLSASKGFGAGGTPTLGGDGFLYSASPYGGWYGKGCKRTNGCGTIWRVGRDGHFQRLHAFKYRDGSVADGTLLRASDGDLYGVATYGGAYASGTLFRLGADGKFARLHQFGRQADGSDGRNPTSGVIEGPGRALYGTTMIGGTDDAGVLYRISGAHPKSPP
jgi:uncharacterized repeat protein (TIGR03803 family)